MFENSLIVVNIELDNARWFLRGLNKPFDPFAQKAMHDTMIGIANCTEAVWAYHIGNEIVLYLNPNAISRCKTMLSGMTRDNLVSYIASLTTVIFNLNYGRLMEKLDKCSNIEKIRLDNYKSKQYLARFDCAVRECDRDITPIIKTIKNTQEMVAKLKPGVNNPTSFNDYDLEFKRDMLPDSVEVKEYTMDNPEGVIL